MDKTAQKPVNQALDDALETQNAVLRQTLSERDQTLSEQSRQIETLQARIQWFERQFNLERARQFAPTSEVMPSLQPDLFNEAEALLDPQAVDDTIPIAAHARKKNKPRTALITDEMIKEVVVHDLDAEDRHCDNDDTVLQPMGYETRRELVIIPEQVYAIEHRYTQYACRQCKQSIKTAPREPRISTGLCSPQAAAAVVVNKFVDHLPLYRQSARYTRQGIQIDRSTLARWMIQHGQAVQSLVNLCRDEVDDYPYQQLDETRQKVLKPKSKGTNTNKDKNKKGGHQGYFWVQRGGPPDRPVVLYHYAGSRAGEVARTLLTGFTGCVQTDAYSPYFKVIAGLSLSHALCNAHARRGFTDAIKAIGDSKLAEHAESMVAVHHYGALYTLERKLKKAKVDYKELEQWYQYRLQRRQQEALPIWKALITWAEQTLRTCRPRSHLGKAVGYLVKYQKQLAVYLNNPLVEIDNNGVENKIRPVALGRNYPQFVVMEGCNHSR